MNRRTKEAYNTVFNFIDEKLFNLSGIKHFFMDYEAAIRNTLRTRYPLAQLCGCQFHLAQAMKKKVDKINGLKPFIKEIEKAKRIYYKLMYLAYLPAHLIVPTFIE